MAFSYTKEQTEGHAGALKVVVGTFTNPDSETGGEVDTGLLNVMYANAASNKSSVTSNGNGCTVSGGKVTIVCDAGVDGWWIAIGY